MKHIWMRLFAILFCIILAFSLPALAEDENNEKENYITNGSFEELDEIGAPRGWRPMGGDWDKAAGSLTENTVYDGKYSMKIENRGEHKNPWVATKVSGLTEGGLYEVSAKIKTERFANNAYATIKMEAYDADGVNIYGEDAVDPFYTDTVGQWADINGKFSVPKGTAYILIYVRLCSAIGIVYYDNVKLTMADPPEKYTFTVNSKVQYDDNETGTATLGVDSYYDGQEVGAETAVDFSITDPATGAVVDSYSVSSMPGDTATYMYPLEKLTELQKEYEVRATAKDAAGNVVGEYSDIIAKFKRPSRLTKDGQYTVKGEVFYPCIGYHVEPRDYQRMAEIGVNVVQMSGSSGTIETQLQEAAKYGMMGLIMMYSGGRTGGHPDNLNSTKTMVEVLKGNENVFAIIPQDEPFMVSYTQEMKDQLWTYYKEVRKIDEDVPVYIVDSMEKYFYEDVKYCDVFYSENYTAGIKASKMAMTQADAAKNAGKFFGALGGVHASEHRAFQTADQLRDTFYRSFAEGVGGIGYYAISDANHVNGDALYKAAPETWEGLNTFVKNEQTELFDYYVGKKYQTFGRFYPRSEDATGGYCEAWIKDGGIMLAVHNHALEERVFELQLISGNGLVSIGEYIAAPVGGATETISGNGSFKVTLPANKAVLYKVTPKSPVDFSKVSQDTGKKNHFVPVGYEEVNADETSKPSGTFSDLDGYEWAGEQIQALYDKGVLNDKNIYAFAPGENITRADFVTFLVRTLGIAGEGEAFGDCDLPEVIAARAVGIANGDTDGNFRPGDPITRQDVFTMLARSVKVAELEDTTGADTMFTDWNLVSDYAKVSTWAMVKAGLIVGNGDGTVNPLGYTTRAEAAVLLYRLQNTDFSALLEGTAAETPEEVAEIITFTGTVSEDALQKWRDAADLIASVGIDEISIENSITKGEFEGLIKKLIGTEYNAFEDDNKALKYTDALKALVKLLGYEVYTERDGGYTGVASRIDLSKGITPGEEYIRGGELAMLLKNAIDIKLCEATSYGPGSGGAYDVKDKTLLSVYKNIYKYEGVVEDNYNTADDLKSTQIRINGENFEGSSDYIGQKVTVYAEDKEEKIIKYIAAKSSVEITEIDAVDVIEEKTNTDTLYYDKDGKVSNIKVSGAVLIKNGRKKAGWTRADLAPAAGTLSLIANNGRNVEYIIVWDYENHVIDKVYAADNQIEFKEGPALTVDLSDNSIKQSLVRPNGQPVTLAAMNEYHILSVAESEDGKVRKIIFVNNAVSGEVTETSDKNVTVNGNVYEIAESLRASRVLSKPKLGQSAQYCLDNAGRIAAVNDTVSGRNYGYFTTAAIGKGLDGKITFRIFTKEGKMSYFDGADNIKLDGVNTSKEDIMNSSLLFTGGTPKGQLVIYKTNQEGRLTEITTATDNCDVPFIEQGGRSEFSCVASMNGPTNATNVQYYRLGARFRFNSGTIVFIVPSAYSDKEEDYAIGDNNLVFTHSTNIGAAKYYDLSNDYYLSAVVNIATPSTVTVKNSPYGVVTGHVKVLDNDGAVSSGVRVVTNVGEEKTLIFPSSEFKINFGDKTLTTIGRDAAKTAAGGRPNTITPDRLNPGDVIQWELDPMTGQVSAMLCVFRYQSPPSLGAVYPTGLAGNYGIDNNYDQQLFGYFKAERVFQLGFATTMPHDWLFNFWSVNTRYAVLLYEKDTGECHKIDYSDVREGDVIVYATWAYMMQIGVVYR